MTPESWLVVTVAATFLLLGIACSPLAWVAIHHRRLRSEQRTEGRWLELSAQVRSLEARLAQFDAFRPGQTGDPKPASAHASPGRWPTASRPGNGAQRDHTLGTGAETPLEPAMIAVPNLAAALNDREASVSGLTQRYAAIWTLADNGGSPEVIARATGQPRGQIDLILGLRRQVDANRTTIPHAPHT